MKGMEFHCTHSKDLNVLEKMVEATWMLCTRTPETQAAHKTKVGRITNGSGTTVDDSSPRKAALEFNDSSGGLGGTRLALVIKCVFGRFHDSVVVVVKGNILGLVALIEPVKVMEEMKGMEWR